MRRRELMVSGDDRWWESPEYEGMNFVGEFTADSTESEWYVYSIFGYNKDEYKLPVDQKTKRFAVKLVKSSSYPGWFVNSMRICNINKLKRVCKVPTFVEDSLENNQSLEYFDMSGKGTDGSTFYYLFMSVQNCPLLEELILPDPARIEYSWGLSAGRYGVVNCPSLRRIKCPRVVMEDFRANDRLQMDPEQFNQIEWDLYD